MIFYKTAIQTFPHLWLCVGGAVQNGATALTVKLNEIVVPVYHNSDSWRGRGRCWFI